MYRQLSKSSQYAIRSHPYRERVFFGYKGKDEDRNRESCGTEWAINAPGGSKRGGRVTHPGSGAQRGEPNRSAEELS